MLLLRCSPLSLAILWRFMLVLPLWAIFYAVLALVSLVGISQLLTSIPLVGVAAIFILPLLLVVISSIVLIHPYLIGIRIGLNVLGVKTDSSQKRLFGASIGYGFIEMAVSFLLMFIIFASLHVIIVNEVNLANAWRVDRIVDPMAELSRDIAFSTLTGIALLSNIAIIALRAALLPVFAGAAAGRDPRSSSHAPMGGFGSNFVSMMLLLLMITAISTAVIPFIGDAFNFVGIFSTLTTQFSNFVLFSFGEEEMSFNLGHAILVLFAITLSVWLFCLQCAGAALSYESRTSPSVRQKPARGVEPQVEAESIGDLLRSRMPTHSN